MFLDLVRNAGSYIIFFVYCALAFLPFVILIHLPSTWLWVKAAYALLVKLTARVLMFATFLPVTYQGVNELPVGPAIFIANHQSTLDIPLVATVLGDRHYCWLAWHDFFEYPGLGMLLRNAAIPVYPREPKYDHVRGAVKAAVKKLGGDLTPEEIKAGVKKLKQGVSIMLFPEGGRYVDNTIHPFFTGCAAMSKLSGAPVVPLFISGTGIALPPGARLIKRYPLMITVGKSFTCGPDETVPAFRDRLYEWYIELNWRRNYLLDHYGIRICSGNLELPEGEFSLS